jgi:hypothetical protein
MEKGRPFSPSNLWTNLSCVFSVFECAPHTRAYSVVAATRYVRPSSHLLLETRFRDALIRRAQHYNKYKCLAVLRRHICRLEETYPPTPDRLWRRPTPNISRP